MTLLSSRIALKHRLTIERNTAEPDEWGNPGPPNWEDHLVDVPCRAWTERGHGTRSGGETIHNNTTVVSEIRRAAVAVGTDITERDRVTEVTRGGVVVFDGPMEVRAIEVYPDHTEIRIVVYRSL